VILDDGMCKLTDYENSLLGLRPYHSAILSSASSGVRRTRLAQLALSSTLSLSLSLSLSLIAPCNTSYSVGCP